MNNKKVLILLTIFTSYSHGAFIKDTVPVARLDQAIMRFGMDGENVLDKETENPNGEREFLAKANIPIVYSDSNCEEWIQNEQEICVYETVEDPENSEIIKMKALTSINEEIKLILNPNAVLNRKTLINLDILIDKGIENLDQVHVIEFFKFYPDWIKISEFKSLRELYIINAGIKSLQEDFLADLLELKILDLSKNLLTAIEANSFKNLPNLVAIMLNDNPIKTFDPIVFEILSKNAIIVAKIATECVELFFQDLKLRESNVLSVPPRGKCFEPIAVFAPPKKPNKSLNVVEVRIFIEDLVGLKKKI